MSSKVTCSCGWSWDKKDSSKKDMYVCHECGKDNTMKDGGWLSKYDDGGVQPNYNDADASYSEDYVGAGYDIVGRNYSPAWGGQFEHGGTVPGSVGFSYARTKGIPSNGPYAKKTKASAQNGKEISYDQWKKQYKLKETPDYNLKRAWELGYTPDKTGHLPTVDNQTGQFLKSKGHPTLKLELDWYNSPEGAEFKSKNTLDSTGKFFKYIPKLQNGKEMQFYQNGLDWKPKSISRDGSVIEDDRGQWDHPGEITKINSNEITMQGVDYPVLGVSDTGDTQMMQPGEDYTYDGNSVTEYPMMEDGGWLSKYDLPKAQTGEKLDFKALMNPGIKQDATKVVRQEMMSEAEAKKFKARKDAEELARRKQAIATSAAAKKKSFSAKQLAEETGAIGDKFRMFPNDPDSFIDEYINPGVTIGNMASGLGRIPLNIQEGDYGEAAMAVGTPLAMGALAGIGTKSTGQFVNNLVNPLPGLDNITKTIKNDVIYPMQYWNQIRKYKNYTSNQSKLLNNPETRKRLEYAGVDPDKFLSELQNTEFTNFADDGSFFMDKQYFTDPQQHQINIDFRQLADLKKRGYSLNMEEVVDHEVGHLMQSESTKAPNKFIDWLTPRSGPTRLDYDADYLETYSPNILGPKAAGDLSYFKTAGRPRLSKNTIGGVEEIEDWQKTERLPFFRETKRELVNQGLLKNINDTVTPETLDQLRNKYTGNRLLGFTNSSNENYIRFSDILNKTPAAALVGSAAFQMSNAKEQKNGGWLDKYQVGGIVPKTTAPIVPSPNVNKELTFEQIPTTDNKKIVINNFSPSYDYVLEGDKTYYKTKAGKTWADISDNKQARENLVKFIDKNNYWAGYGSGENKEVKPIQPNENVLKGKGDVKYKPTVKSTTPLKKESSVFDDVSNYIGSEIDSLGNKSKKLTSDLKNELSNTITEVKNSVASGTSNAIQSLEDVYQIGINGIKRKYATHTGNDDDVAVPINTKPKSVSEYYGDNTPAQISAVIDAPKGNGRQFKQQVVPTSAIQFGVRNRGEYKDIETDGLEVTTFNPFTKDPHPDNTSVLAIDSKGTLHTGSYKDFKGKPGYLFSKTFKNKIVSFPEKNGKSELISGEKSGNPNYKQPAVQVLDDKGKLVNGSMNILVKDQTKKDYYGSIEGGRVLFVNPTTKEQYLVSGSMNHIKEEFKKIKGNEKYLEAYTLDNGTYSRGLSYKDKKLTPERLKSYDLENTSGGNGLYIKNYSKPINKFQEEYVENMPNIRTEKDESYKKGHPLKNKISNVVLHHTAYENPETSEQEVRKQYMTPGQNSSHVVIQENGKRDVYASPEQVTFHAGESSWNNKKDVNDFSIGVEFQGNTSKKPLTQAQIESFVEYYAPIAKKYNLSLKDIVTHEMVAPGRKGDVSKKEYARIIKYMKDNKYK